MTRGRGFHEGYWGQFGVPRERMLGRYLESVRIIEQALAAKGERFSVDGDFYSVRDGVLSRDCYQQPRFPFWGGGQFPVSIERCATYAESWTCDDFPILSDTWNSQVGAYRARARITLAGLVGLKGVEQLWTQNRSITIPVGAQPFYVDLARNVQFWDLRRPVFIAFGIVAVAWIVLDRTEIGR